MDSIEIKVSNPKMKRTLERFKAKISTGDFYEAHQTLRTIANRNVRSKSFNDAIDLLYHGAQILLKSSQPSTGSDLVLYLLEVYNESETKCDSNSKSKLIDLVSLFDATEPTLKQVSVEIINWSIKFGDQKFGDPDLHFVIAQKFIQNDDLVYETEKNLVLGTQDGFQLYLNLIWNWYKLDTKIDPYVSRAVIRYLTLGNIKNAKEALNFFIKNFIESNPTAKYNTVKEFDSEFLIFDSFPIFNFLQLLIITIQTKNQTYFKRLIGRYSTIITELQLQESINQIGELYLGLVTPKQGNIMQDLMANLFK